VEELIAMKMEESQVQQPPTTVVRAEMINEGASLVVAVAEEDEC
jgi:hypothetical protein